MADKRGDNGVFARYFAALHDSTIDTVLVCGHRGLVKGEAETRAPENSLANLEACIQRRMPMAELDVRFTRDGVMTLMHDSKLMRTTGHPGRAEELDWDELRRLRLLHRDGRISDEHLPLLEEALELVRGRILIKLHPKCEHARYPELLEVLRRTDTLRQVMVWEFWRPGSVEDAERDAVFAAHPELAEMTFLVNIIDPAHLDDAIAYYRPRVVEVEFTQWDAPVFAAETVARIRAAGVRAGVNCQGRGKKSAGIGDEMAATAPEAGWGVFIDRGFTFMQTDEPEAVMAFLEGRRTHVQQESAR